MTIPQADPAGLESPEMSDTKLGLRVLGTCTIDRCSEPLQGPVCRAQSLAVLARIAVGGEAGVPRDALVELFWPDARLEGGRHSLANLLYQARAALGREAVCNRGDLLSLPSDRWRVDHWEFARAIESGDERRALSAYGGHFLDGIRVTGAGVERWIEAERRALVNARLRILERLARQAGDRSDGEAVRWWQLAVDEDPLHSARTCELMLALARTGDQAGAIRQAELHASLRRATLDLDPDPSVTRLEIRIRKGEALPADPFNAASSRPASHAIRGGERERPSVAVLPFTDLTPDASLPHIALGVAIELSHTLTAVPGLSVAAWSSASALASRALDRREIAESLGVDSIVEGTVRRDGERLSLTAQLMDGGSGFQVWSERFIGSVSELSAIEEKIGQAVIDRFVSASIEKGPEDRPSGDAHEAYLKGLLLESEMSWRGFERAATHFEAAVSQDPDFVPALVGLARTSVMAVLGVPTRDPLASLERAKECADRALELAPHLGDVHVAGAFATLFVRWDLAEAAHRVRRGLTFGVTDPSTLPIAALTLSVCAEDDKACEVAADATSRDPHGYFSAFVRCYVNSVAGDDPTALLAPLLREHPDGVWGPLLLALQRPDRPDEVVELTRRAVEDLGVFPFPLALAVAARAQAGRGDGVDPLLESFASLADEAHGLWLERATVLAGAGRRAEAARALVRAIEARELNALLVWRFALFRDLVQRDDVAAAMSTLGLAPSVRAAPERATFASGSEPVG